MKDTVSKTVVTNTGRKEAGKANVITSNVKEEVKKPVSGTVSGKEDTKKSVDNASSKEDTKKIIDNASSKENTKKPIDTASKGLTNTIKQKKDNDLEKKRQHTREYMKKQDFVYLRLPSKNEELGIPDYKQMVKDYAAGKGVSVNALLTALVEKELKIKITSLAFIRENMKSEARQDIINK